MSVTDDLARIRALIETVAAETDENFNDILTRINDLSVHLAGRYAGLTAQLVDAIATFELGPVAAPAPQTWDGWYWPTPIWHGEVPVISDPFRRLAVGTKGQRDYRRQHLGVDTTFKNGAAMRPSPPDNTKWYYHPPGVPMLAAGPGTLWYAGKTATGWTVKIDHHDYSPDGNWVTYYTHMAELYVPLDDKSAKGVELMGGEEIGIIGDNPRSPDDIRHSHFEIWDYSPGVASGRVNRALDPAPYYKFWSKKSLPQEAHVGLDD